MTAAQLWLLWEIGTTSLSRLHIQSAKRKLAKQRMEKLTNAYKNVDSLSDDELDALIMRRKKDKDS